MAKDKRQRANVLQGTLDMLILRTLILGPAHGHEIGKHIQRTTDDLLQVQHGSHLSRTPSPGAEGLAYSKSGRRLRIAIGKFKYYRLTATGKKQLLIEESKWKQMGARVATGHVACRGRTGNALGAKKERPRTDMRRSSPAIFGIGG